MVAFSKYFYQTVTAPRTNCAIIHDGTCWESTLWNFTRTLPGCIQFVLPLALIPIIMKIKRLNRDVFKRSAGIFVKYLIGAWLIGGCGLSFICFYRILMGRLTYFTTLAMPSATGALICSIFLPDDVVHTYAHGLSSICAEVLLKGSDFFILKYLRSSRAAFTCALMVVNTLLMHGLRENSDGGFYWLIQPSKRKFEDQCHGSICAHDSDCTSYVLEGINSFAKFGIGLEIARGMIYNYSLLLKSPLIGLRNLFGRLNWNLIAFLIAYVGIYRAANCVFATYNENNDPQLETKHHLFASALSGLAFYLYPNTSIFGHIVITAIELFWKLNKAALKEKFKWLPIDVVSMNVITFPIVFGIMNHVRAFTPWLAPSMLKKLMSLSTNYKDEDIYTRYHAALFGLERQFVI